MRSSRHWQEPGYRWLTAGVRQRHFDTRTLMTVALWTAVGIGTKVTCLGLLPVSIGVVAGVGHRSSAPLRKIASQVGLILLATAALSGWWYARNLVQHGDPLRRAEASAMWRERIPGYASLAEQGENYYSTLCRPCHLLGMGELLGCLFGISKPAPYGVLCLPRRLPGALLLGYLPVV
jgi:hypothetical protein